MARAHGYGNGGVEELCVDHDRVIASGGGVHDLDLDLAEIGGECQEDRRDHGLV